MKRTPMRENVWFFIIMILLAANLFLLIRLRGLQKNNSEFLTTLAEQRSEVKALNRQSERTYTTGLLKKSSFFRDAAATMQSRGEGTCALAAMDGDEFSHLYRTYGRSVTDGLTLRIADILRSHFPENEDQLLCNVSDRSDEFLLLLLHRPSREALLCELEEFRAEVSAEDYLYNGSTIRSTVSIGVVFPPEGTEDIKVLYDYACEAQTYAKQAGGNCLRTWGQR